MGTLSLREGRTSFLLALKIAVLWGVFAGAGPVYSQQEAPTKAAVVPAPAPTPTPTPTPSDPQDKKSSPALATSPSISPTAAPSPALQIPATPPGSEGAKASEEASSSISITKIVGEAGQWFITSREVKINFAIEQVLMDPSKPGIGRLAYESERAFVVEVSRVLDEWVVFLEAKALSSPLPSRAEVARVSRLVTDRWSAKSEWQDLEVSSDELKDIVERKLMARDFERLKSDPQLSPVSDDEALAYFRKNRLRFGSLPFETFKDNIKSFLVKSLTERRLAEWHEVLRRKYKVRNFVAG